MQPNAERALHQRLVVPFVFGLLALATFGAFALAQRSKRNPLVLDKIVVRRVFTPNGDCRNDKARFRFRVTRSDQADITIVNADDDVVRTLSHDRFLHRYRFIVVFWDGLTDAGNGAPTGPYRLRIVLLGQDRELITAPKVRLHKGSFSDSCGSSTGKGGTGGLSPTRPEAPAGGEG